MPGRRSILVLATMAALLVAPSSVLAAQPNELRAPAINPRSGSTLTPFELSVQYRSSAGNPAQSVTASLAGLTVPLSLVSGTAVKGTWTRALLLPSGSWTVSFHATVASGPQPTVSAGTVTVGSGAPLASSSGSPSGSVVDPIDDGGTGVGTAGSTGGSGSATGQPAPQGTAMPLASSEPAPSNKASEPQATPKPAAAARGGGSDNHPRASMSRGRAGEHPSPHQAAAASGGGAPGSGGNPPESPADDDPGFLWLVLLIGMSGVAATALGGTAWVLMAGRRERATETADADLPIRAIPTVEQRAVRRARLRASNDPILAGMGLDEPGADQAAADRANASRQRARTRARRSTRPTQKD
jgi:hypothetical protein